MRLHLGLNIKRMRKVLKRMIFPERVMREEFENYQKDFQLPEHVFRKRVLDVGCNRGEFFSYLRQQKGNREAFGVDVRPKRNIEGYIRASVTSLPFADGWFDFVVARNFVPMFIPALRGMEVEGIIREMLRVVHPGGMLFFNAMDMRLEILSQLSEPNTLVKWDVEKLDAVAAFEQFLLRLEGEEYRILRVRRKRRMIYSVTKPLAA